MTPKTFTCAECQETFEIGWSDGAAEAEMKTAVPVVAGDDWGWSGCVWGVRSRKDRRRSYWLGEGHSTVWRRLSDKGLVHGKQVSGVTVQRVDSDALEPETWNLEPET